MKTCIQFLMMTLFLCFSLQAFELEKTSLKPTFEWAPIKKTKNYKVIIKELDASGQTVSKTKEVLNNETTSFQPTENLIENTVYQVTIKARRKNKPTKKFRKYIKPIDSESFSESKILEIQAADLFPANGTSPASYNLTGPQATEAAGQFIAPIHLPNGATITKATFYSNEISSSSFVNLIRSTRPFNTQEQIFGFNWTGGDESGSFSKQSSEFNLDETVDTENYQYYIHSIMGGNDKFQSLVIEYTE